MHATSTSNVMTRTSIPPLSLPISGRPHSKIIALLSTTSPHEYIATRHDGFVARPMRLVSANSNLIQSIAHGQAYELNDANGQPFLFLGQRPGLRGGAPDAGMMSRSELMTQLRASGHEDLVRRPN